ncbi:MAG: hypothetical protein BGO98_19635 [Myxococcales bacterium 68-20]|nr:MAG: hypothetical protein BGO98_19635 [Myxococcales bacterium 68-20]
MTHEQVTSVIIKHLVRSIDELTPETVDVKKSMKDYGANSLDIVEVVSASMRELKVKVPRAELATITNIDGLATVLLRVWNEKQAAAPNGAG